MPTGSIRLNGERHDLEEAVSVQRLLDDLGLSRERVAVEVNRRILRRSEFEQVVIEAGDDVEVVTFVGGG